MNKTGKRNLFCLILFFILLPVLTFALEINYPQVPGATAPQDFADQTNALPLYIKYLFSLSVWGVGFVVAISLIIGGLRYFFSAGNVAEMISAKSQVSSALWGVSILLSSVLLLQTISPQFTVLEINPLEQVKIIEEPENSPPLPGEYSSLISTELPFGKVIQEKILETKIYEEQKTGEPRMTRIKQVGENFLKLGEKIEEQSKELVDYSKKCSCSRTDPCCEHVFTGESENPSESCPDNTCATKPGCTCDPCKDARDDIQKKEKENLEAIYIGTKIKQNNKEIKTSLKEEQKKAAEEIRLIKEELAKLDRIEIFMHECPIWNVINLSDFLYSKDYYLNNKWTHETVNFWEDIRVKEDWASFYCRVSGTHWEGGEYIFGGLETLIKTSIPMGLSGSIETGQATPCTEEIPVGEIFDRTRRVGYKLVERLEKLINLSEELTKAVDDLHILISQCSSRGPTSDPLRKGCYSICHKSALGICIKYCQGQACPDEAISKKLQEITDIVKGIPNEESSEEKKKEKEGIKDVVEGKKKEKQESLEDEETREQIGIKPIIEDIVPKILEDLQYSIRDITKGCVADYREKNKLLNCLNARNGIKPDGRIISACCYTQDYFQECLSQCYLEKGIKDYKKCLNKCLEKQAQKYGIEDIKNCLHLVNFYCCTL